MQFSANDIFQLDNLLNPEKDEPKKGIFTPNSIINPGNLGTPSISKEQAKKNHKIKATINRKPMSPKKTFSAKGRLEPEHEVNPKKKF